MSEAYREQVGGPGREADWDRLAEREVATVDPSEAVPATGDDAEQWNPGMGHRVKKISGRFTCVVCGDGWDQWPTATCPGPSGVAL